MCSMSCFPCFGKRKKEKEEDNVFNDGHHPTPANIETQPKNIELQAVTETGNTQVQSFTFRELATATKNFTPDCLLGEGGLGRVYKGSLANGQTVAIKKLGRDSLKEINEFLVEVSNLSLLNHPNLVSLVGYCADGEQRLLVHDFIPNGSLENHLFDLKQDQKPLDWYTRMKIAYGAAQGLEYLHDKTNPPIIYRELKSSNFLLDHELKPKLSDYGLGKLGASGDKPLLSSSLMGTYGYCAPECSMGGEVTVKSDVYSFGVVLLELITGRRALDTSMPSSEQNLVSWAQPMFRDQKRYLELADPKLKNDYSACGLNQAVAIASMCLQDEPSVRPMAADVVTTLSFLIEPAPTPNPDVPTKPKAESEHSDSSCSDSDSSDDEHVVETLQLGKKKQKQGSRTSSKSHSSNGSALNSKRPIYDDYGCKKGSSGKLCSSSKYYDDAYEFDENEGSSSSKNHEERSLSIKHSKKGSKKKGSNSKHHENNEDTSESEREEHHEVRSSSVKHSKKGRKKKGSSSKHHEIDYEDTSENEEEKCSKHHGSDSPGSRHEEDDHERGSDDSGSRHSDEEYEGSNHEYESD